MHSSAGFSPHRRNLMQGVGGGLREQHTLTAHRLTGGDDDVGQD
jgi:hypothetical protein